MIEPTEQQIDAAARAIHEASDDVLPYEFPGPDPRTTSPRVLRRTSTWQDQRIAGYRKAGQAAAFAVLNPEVEAERQRLRHEQTHGATSRADRGSHP